MTVTFFVSALLLQYLLGNTINLITHNLRHFINRLAAGFVLELALYQIVYICVKNVYKTVDFPVKLCLIISIILCIPAILDITIREYRRIKEKKYPVLAETLMNFNWYGIMICGMIVLYIILLSTYYVPYDTSDEYFMGAVVQEYENNSLSINDPYTGSGEYEIMANLSDSGYIAMIAGLSRILGIHPAIFIHNHWMIFIVIMMSISWYMFSDMFFETRREKSIFVAMALAINMFTVYSKSSLSVEVFSSIWQGKVILMLIIIPLDVIGIVLAVDRGKKIKSEGGALNWLYVGMLNMAALLLTPMSIMVVMADTLCMMVYYTIHNKSFRNLIFYVMANIPFVIYLIIYFVQ